MLGGGEFINQHQSIPELPFQAAATTALPAKPILSTASKIIADSFSNETQQSSTIQMSERISSISDRAISDEYKETESYEDIMMEGEKESIQVPTLPDKRLKKINDQAAKMLDRIQKIFDKGRDQVVFDKLYPLEEEDLNHSNEELKKTIGEQRYIKVLNHLRQNAPAYFDQVSKSRESLLILADGEQLLIKPSGKVYFRLLELGRGNYKTTDKFVLIASAVSDYMDKNRWVLRAISLPTPKQWTGSEKTPEEKQSTIENQKEILLNNFIKEQSKLFPMDHVNVVKSLSYLRPDLQGTVTEVFDGDVNSQLAEKTLTLRDRYQIAYQMAEGVKELHAVGVVHRDIKPDNFLIRRSGEAVEVKITDFGTSSGPGKLKSRGNKFYNLIVDPLWSRSASIRDDSRFSTASDVYQLGVALCMTLTNTTIDEFNLQRGQDMQAHRLPTLLNWKMIPRAWSIMDKIEDEETRQFLLRMVNPVDASKRPSSAEVSQFFKSKSITI